MRFFRLVTRPRRRLRQCLAALSVRRRRDAAARPLPSRCAESLQARCEPLEDRILLTFGPSPLEQELFEHVNRARLDPAAELDILLSSHPDPLLSVDPYVQAALTYFQVDGQLLESQWATLSAQPPLAWSDALFAAAERHNQVMIAADTQAHHVPALEPSLLPRLLNAGYSDLAVAGENVFAFAESIFHAHAGLLIDWGDGAGGLQSPDHRRNILGSEFHDLGVAVAAENSGETQVGPLVITQDFGSIAGTRDANILGVVYDDADGDGLYDAGEGLGNLTVTASGAAGTYNTTTWAAGGYQIAVPPGTYDVTLSGGRLSFPITRSSVVVAGQNYASLDAFQNANIKVDFEISYMGDLSLAFAAAEVLESAGDKATHLTVTRSGGVSQAVSVTLQPDVDAMLSVPETIVIPAGEESVTVSVGVIDDNTLEGPQSVALVASANGYQSGSAMIDVIDDEIVTLVGPDGTIGDTTPTFEWNALDGAVGYDLWVDRRDGARRIVTETNIAETRFTAKSDLPAGEYVYWARARNAAGALSRWSEMGAVTIDAASPGVPELLAPAASISETRPTLVWTVAENAESYELWVDQTGVERTIHETDLRQTEFTPELQLPLGQYRAWVRSRDAAGKTSPWSAPRDFSIVDDVPRPGVPELTSPPSVTSSRTPLVEWTELAVAARYELWIEATPSEPVRIVHEVDLTKPRYQFESQLELGEYRVWVRAFNSENESSAWSRPRDFRIVSDVPSPLAPSFTAPLYPTSDTHPTFTWTSGLYDAEYILWIQALGAASPLLVTTTTQPRLTSSKALDPGAYQAWVNAVNSEGERGPWSSVLDFVIVDDVPVPGTPEVTGPASVVTDTTPTMTWTADATAAYYDLWVDQVDGFRKIIRVRTGPETSFTPSTELPADATYRLWVRAVNSELEAGSWSDPYEFTVVSQLPAEDGDPAAGDPGAGLLVAPLPELVWSPVDGAARYDLYLVRTESAEVVFERPGLTDTRFQPNLEVPVGDYLAVVRPLTAEGQLADVDQTLRVVVAAPLRPAPVVTFELHSAENDFQFRWAAEADSGQTGTGDLFEFRVERIGTALPVVWADRLAATSYVVDGDLLQPGDYRVWVRVSGEEGPLSDWSQPVGFEVAASVGEAGADNSGDDSAIESLAGATSMAIARDNSIVDAYTRLSAADAKQRRDEPDASVQAGEAETGRGRSEVVSTPTVDAATRLQVLPAGEPQDSVVATREALDLLLRRWPDFDWWSEPETPAADRA